MFRSYIVTLLITLYLGGCSSFNFPGVYKLRIQQGNVITQQMIDRLKPGMSKSQVKFVLGNPLINDSLEIERWDYVYTIQISGGELNKQMLSVFFEEDRLTYFVGNYLPSEQVEGNVTEENS